MSVLRSLAATLRPSLSVGDQSKAASPTLGTRQQFGHRLELSAFNAGSPPGPKSSRPVHGAEPSGFPLHHIDDARMRGVSCATLKTSPRHGQDARADSATNRSTESTSRSDSPKRHGLRHRSHQGSDRKNSASLQRTSVSRAPGGRALRKVAVVSPHEPLPASRCTRIPSRAELGLDTGGVRSGSLMPWRRASGRRSLSAHAEAFENDGLGSA